MAWVWSLVQQSSGRPTLKRRSEELGGHIEGDPLNCLQASVPGISYAFTSDSTLPVSLAIAFVALPLTLRDSDQLINSSHNKASERSEKLERPTAGQLAIMQNSA